MITLRSIQHLEHLILDTLELQRAIDSMKIIRNGETIFPLENYKCDLFVGRSTVEGTFSTYTDWNTAPFIRCLFDHIHYDQSVSLENNLIAIHKPLDYHSKKLF